MEENLLCGTLLLITCLIAFTICIADLQLFITVPQLNTTFGRLCFSQRVADLLLILCFMLYMVPMIIAHPEKDGPGYVSFVTFIIFPLHFCSKLADNPKSFNRFVAVCFPMKYDNSFNKTLNIIFIGFLWTFPIVWAIIPLANRDCQLYFYSNCWCILNDFSKACGQSMETYALGYVQIASAFLSILLDSFTFMRLWKYSKEQRKLFHESSSRKKSYKREIYFLIQTVAADLIILVNLGIVFGIGAAENQTRVYYFIIQTELWVLVDTEKLIMSFICNLRIKRIYAEPSNNNARKINSVAPKSASGISRVN